MTICHTPASLLYTVLLTACPSQHEPPLSDAPTCDTGYVADGDTCVPEACGTGTWGGLPVDAGTVYVSAEADEGGDGSAEAPLRGIQAALDLAGSQGGGLVAVAAGTYAETLTLTSDHAGVHLAGRCRDLVTLDASVGEEDAAGIAMALEDDAAEISGLTVRGAPKLGLVVVSGTVTGFDLILSGNGTVGAVAYQSEGVPTILDLSDTLIEDTVPDSDGIGYGFLVFAGASATLTRCTVAGSTWSAVGSLQAGTHLTLVDSTVRDTAPNPHGLFGYGICVSTGASLEARGSTVETATESGIAVMDADTTVTLIDTTVTGTRRREDEGGGYGLIVSNEATVSATSSWFVGNESEGVVAEREASTSLFDCHLDENLGHGMLTATSAVSTIASSSLGGNWGGGLAVMDESTRVELNDSRVEGNDWVGVAILDAEETVLDGCFVDGNSRVGLAILGASALVTVSDCSLSGNRQSDPSRVDGQGIQAAEDASLLIDGCVLDGNTAGGLVLADGATAEVYASTISNTQPTADLLAGHGLEVQYGGHLIMDGSLIDGNRAVGAVFFDEGTTAELTDTVITGTTLSDQSAGMGLVALLGAQVEASGLTVEGNAGPGLVAITPGTVLSCDDCSLLDNEFAGAVAVWDATLAISGATIAGTEEHVNLGGGVGVYAAPWSGGPPSLTLTDSDIHDNPIAGVWLTGDGSYEIRDSLIGGGAGLPLGDSSRCGDAVFASDGVAQWDGAVGLLLEGDTLLGGQGAGLFLDSASATLVEVTWSDNAVDLVSQGEGCAEPPAGYEDATIGSADLCPAPYDYPTCADQFTTHFDLDALASKGADSRGLPAPVPVRSDLTDDGGAGLVSPVGIPVVR
ncbi:MAG: right-handed parallel beta-helix repeat-containing protein [Pseudomonadota bacterium]